MSGVAEWRDDYQPPATASDSQTAASSSAQEHGPVVSAPRPSMDVCRKRTFGSDVNRVAASHVDTGASIREQTRSEDVSTITRRPSGGASGNVRDVCEPTRRSIGVQVHASQDISRSRMSGRWRHAIQVGVQVGDSLGENLGSRSHNSKRKSDSGLQGARVGWQRT